jgi:hypothetical protein
MNAFSSHKMLRANCQNLYAYTIVKQGRWPSNHDLLVDVPSLSKSSKEALNLSTKFASNSFNNEY